jgi:hypothetical protein
VHAYVLLSAFIFFRITRMLGNGVRGAVCQVNFVVAE